MKFANYKKPQSKFFILLIDHNIKPASEREREKEHEKNMNNKKPQNTLDDRLIYLFMNE